MHTPDHYVVFKWYGRPGKCLPPPPPSGWGVPRAGEWIAYEGGLAYVEDVKWDYDLPKVTIFISDADWRNEA